MQPVSQTGRQSGNQAAREPVSELGSQTVKQPGRQPVEESSSHSASQGVEQPVRQAGSEAGSEASQSGSQSSSQADRQTVMQSSSQAVKQSGTPVGRGGTGRWGWGAAVVGAKVLVEITSSTPAPRSIATVEVKAPGGEGVEGRSSGEGRGREEAAMNNKAPSPLVP